MNKSTYESGHQCKFDLFGIQGAGVNAGSGLVAVGGQEVVADLREERSEHADVEPNGFIGILQKAPPEERTGSRRVLGFVALESDRAHV